MTEFINLMQLNIVSYAIRYASNKEQQESIREHYSHSDLDWNSSTTTSYISQLMLPVSIETVFKIEPMELWLLYGEVGGIHSRDLAIKNDTVIAACFAAQVLWIKETNEDKRNKIELTVRSGDLTHCHSNDWRKFLAIEQIFYLDHIREMLKSDPTYEFRVYWGFVEACKVMYIFGKTISEREKYEDHAFVSKGNA